MKEKITVKPVQLLPRLWRKGLINLQPNLPVKGGSSDYDTDYYCGYHQCAGHHTNACATLRAEIRKLQDEEILDENFKIRRCYRGSGLSEDIVVILLAKGQALNLKDPRFPMQHLYECLRTLGHIRTAGPDTVNFRYIGSHKKSCDYHEGDTGHSIQECADLVEEIEELIELGIVAIHQEPDLSKEDPFLPTLQTSMASLFWPLVHFGYISPDRAGKSTSMKKFDPKKFCEFHGGRKGHDVEDCYQLRVKVGELVEEGRIQTRPYGNNIFGNIIVAPGNVICLRTQVLEDSFSACSISDEHDNSVPTTPRMPGYSSASNWEITSLSSQQSL